MTAGWTSATRSTILSLIAILVATLAPSVALGYAIEYRDVFPNNTDAAISESFSSVAGWRCYYHSDSGNAPSTTAALSSPPGADRGETFRQ